MKSLPIKSIKIGTRCRRDVGDLTALVESLKTKGLLHPVVVDPDHRLIAGERRLLAAKELGWKEIPVTVVTNLDDAVMRLEAERDENTCRKDLTPGEAVAVGKRLEEIERPKAKERQKEHADTAPGKKGNTGGKLPQVSKGKTRDKVAEALGMSGKTYEKAKAVVESGDKKLIQQMNESRKVDAAFRELRRQEQQENLRTVAKAQVTAPPSERRYAAIVIDPPWPIEKIARDVRPRQADIDYPTMTLEQIKALTIPAMKNAHLYLWVTHKHLPIAFEIVKAWGFKYECLMTWVKNVGFTPFSWMYSTEHVLFCRRGSLDLLCKGKRLDFSAKVREHSRKPEEFYQLVASVSPEPRLDIFSREKRDGFDQMGNETGKF